MSTCVVQASVTSWAIPFQLIIGEEWTSIVLAAPWGALIQSTKEEKVPLLHKYWWKNHKYWWKNHTRPNGILSTFSGQLASWHRIRLNWTDNQMNPFQGVCIFLVVSTRMHTRNYDCEVKLVYVKTVDVVLSASSTLTPTQGVFSGPKAVGGATANEARVREVTVVERPPLAETGSGSLQGQRPGAALPPAALPWLGPKYRPRKVTQLH